MARWGPRRGTVRGRPGFRSCRGWAAGDPRESGTRVGEWPGRGSTGRIRDAGSRWRELSVSSVGIPDAARSAAAAASEAAEGGRRVIRANRERGSANGRGADRGGGLIHRASAGQELTYRPLGNLTRHGPRPPRLPKLPRVGGG